MIMIVQPRDAHCFPAVGEIIWILYIIIRYVMEFGWSRAERQFRAALREFIGTRVGAAASGLVPGEEPYSAANLTFCAQLAGKGWLVPHWPARYGGSDASPWMFAILSEELWAAGEPRGSQYMNVNWIGPAIIAAGTDAQREEHLTRIAAGNVLWCQGFSEINAGSDLRAMETFARREGDHYIITGEKVWTSYASRAEFCFLLARTQRDEHSKGSISIFLVPMRTPGIRVEVIPSMLDVHEIHRLTFDQVVVPATARLGAENMGWPIIRDALSDERVGTPRYARAEIVLDQLMATAVAQGQHISREMQLAAARARAACRAARLMSYQSRQQRAQGSGASADAYLGRVAIVRAEREVAAVALALTGEDCLVKGSLADGEVRTAMIAGLGGGSYEMQLNLIARLWLSLPKG
jgi:alkylation response protein AidB-like acyl-CoA dehydrogenase